MTRIGGGWAWAALVGLMLVPARAGAGTVWEQNGFGPPPSGAVAVTPVAASLPAEPILQAAQGASDGGGGRIFMSALYGGLAGALVGAGIALIENDNWGRDIAIGAGVGILAGAALGAANVFADTRSPVFDGMGSTARDPVMRGHAIRVGGQL
jgi:hypothetical protein